MRTATAPAMIVPEVTAEVSQAALLRARLGDSMPKPTGYNVLIAIYVRPAYKDLGDGKRLHYADKTRDEDKYQGNVAMVLALGPDAYTEDKYTKGAWCKVGDWVTFPSYENQATKFELDGVVLATIPDDKITTVITDPQLATRIR